MTKEESAKVYAIKYVLDFQSFKKNERLKDDLLNIRISYNGDEEFDAFVSKYVNELSTKEEMPRWARLIMAERYKINI